MLSAEQGVAMTAAADNTVTRDYTPWIIAGGLCLLNLVVFWGVWNFDRVNYDDNVFVFEHPAVKHGLTGPGISNSIRGGIKGLWHPLTYLSHMLDIELFGLNPKPMHAVSLLLHMAATVLLFVVLRRLLRQAAGLKPPLVTWVSAFGAAAFAVHPQHVEPVAWIVSRKDVLSAFILMFTLWAYIRYTEKRSLPRYLVVALLFFLGLTAKPTLLPLPGVLLLLDIWPLSSWAEQSWPERWQRLRPRILEKLPLAGLSVIIAIVTYRVQVLAGAVPPDGDRISFEGAFYGYGTALWRTLAPLRLTCFYPHPTTLGRSWPLPVVLGGAAALLVLSILAIAQLGKRPWIAVGWFWFVGMLTPVCGFVPFSGHLTADRYNYVPHIGIFLAVAVGLASVWQHKKWKLQSLIAISTVPVLVWAALAYRQARTWQNSETLWKHAIRLNDRNFVAHNNLGIWYAEHGREEEAARHFAKGGETGGRNNRSLYNQAVGHLGAGQYTAAAKTLEELIRKEPMNLKARVLAAHVQTQAGNTVKAEAILLEVLELSPGHAEAAADLGGMLVEQYRAAEAVPILTTAINRHPTSIKLLNTMAAAHAQQGNIDKARQQLKRILQLDPANTLARRNLKKLETAAP